MLFSIITPSFNQGQYIEETIRSVLNQTFRDYEYIVIDGGSTDNTLEILSRYKSHITKIISEKDYGQSDAINKGFKIANGELVGWINSDDILYPNCLENIANLYFRNKDSAIFYNSRNIKIDADGKVIKSYSKRIYCRNYLIHINYDLIQQGSFYKSSFVEMVNYLDQNLHYCMDLDLWLKLLNHGKISFTNAKPQSAFRLWESSKTVSQARFHLEEIKQTLIKNGASKLSPSLLKLSYFELVLYWKLKLNKFNKVL